MCSSDLQDFVNIKTPNGENFLELSNRTNSFLDAITQKNHRSVAIVTHAGNIRSVVSSVLGLPLANAFRIELGYGAVLSLKIETDRNMSKLLSIN